MNRATLAFVCGVAAAASLPAAGRFLRRGGPPRCDEDGVALERGAVARVESAGRERAFCCVSCADAWLRRERPEDAEVRVTDETSGREIDAREAVFVESLVVAVRPTGCRIHAFAERSDAERHVREYRGFVLEGDERPLVPGAAR